MSGDYLDAARRRLTALRQAGAIGGVLGASECEKSEINEESPPSAGVISHISLPVPAEMEADNPLFRARRRRQELQGTEPSAAMQCEISEESEESRADGGLISLFSLISQSVPMQTEPDEALSRARRHIHELRRAGGGSIPHCEKSEKSEERCPLPCPPASEPTPALLANPFRAWRLHNAERLTDIDRRQGHDRGGFCAAHGRWLSYPEQRRGACSWCVPVDRGREPEYRASHWRKFAERRP